MGFLSGSVLFSGFDDATKLLLRTTFAKNTENARVYKIRRVEDHSLVEVFI